MANLSNINFNGKEITIKDTYAREQIKHLTSDNYTADVTGDYTVNAGNLATTATNTTMHTTADRIIDTDGNDSVHIDGASTLSVGGLRTETFAGDKTESVTGTQTEKAGNRNTTVTGTQTERAGNRNTTVTGTWAVNLPGRAFDMKDVALQGDVKKEIDNLIENLKSPLYINVKDYGVKGDGVTDDSVAIQKVINDNIGKTIFFPVGTYIVTKSIVLPDNTTILGENHEAKLIAKANNIIVFTNNAYLQHGKTPDQSDTRCNITIKTITINGNFVESPWTNYNLDQPAINTGIIGIALYGDPIRLYDVWVYNCEQFGIVTVNGGGNSENSEPINEESIFLNCVVKFNGKHGWQYFGPHDAMMCNCVVASNSRLKHNTYSNLMIEKYNLRIVNSHFYSDYGVCKPQYAIVLAENAAQCNISNCHIEGGGTANLCINSAHHQISNCHIYASFGITDIEMNSAFNMISNCLLDGRVTGEPGVSTDAWVGAFKFNSTFYNYIDCELNNTSLIDVDRMPNFNDCHMVIRGSYEGHNAINPLDRFNAGSNYIEIMGNFTDTNTIILPMHTTLKKLTPWGEVQGFNLSDNMEMTSYVSVVWAQNESKTLTIPRATYGSYLIIVNRTGGWLHLKAKPGDTINEKSEGYGSPNKSLILVCGADTQWLTADVQETKPSSN